MCDANIYLCRYAGVRAAVGATVGRERRTRPMQTASKAQQYCQLTHTTVHAALDPEEQ